MSTTKIEAPETQDTLFRGGETFILFRGLRASRLPPLWDCF